MTVVGEHRLLIDGKLVEAGGGGTFDNVNPATEEVLGQTADGTAADMAAAIAAARHAFDTSAWATDRELRKRCILQLQAAIEGEQEDLRAELVAEVGCPVLITYGPQLDAPLREALRWPVDQIDTFPWSRELGPKDAFAMGMDSQREVWKEPIGVVGVIVPWNFPVEIILNKLGPILAMGNTCVLKPAPDTPWNATRIGRLVAERTDLPPGVVNVVASSDHLVGEVLTSSPLVDMVAFTGSTATGRRVMTAAATTLKPVFLELGGKSVNLVLDDADLASTIPGASAVCFHAGQGCAIPTRLMVPRARYDECVELAVAGFEGVSYGDPTDPGNLMGPLVSQRQRERVLGYIESGRAQGARVAFGGGRPAHLDRGWYVEPTLLVDVDNAMTVAREEIFGPVLVVIPYDDDDDAVRIANDSPYGLSGAITSGDLDHAKAIARRIRTGTLGLNGGLYYGADAPFGGYKQSGIGRQCGIEGLEMFTQTKTVAWPA
ncbi:MAG TPA: aldehyde dehydrogenase family protein [Acidimicrobiales bacterium]|nr:aldehyde dehydrogenase family protein [Acidimicrobiales bacterium]